MNEGTDMPIKSILVATDLSAHENKAVVRAQQLARAHNASLRLVYVPPHGHAAEPGAHAELAAMARRIGTDLLLDVQALPAGAGSFEEVAANAAGVDLVVVPQRRERSLAAFFRGQPVMRLLRECKVPVLVTRNAPDRPYARMVVAVDLSKHALVLGAFAGNLQPSAELRLFHAVALHDEAKLVFAGATGQAIKIYRQRWVANARNRLREVSNQLGVHGSRLMTQIGRGDAARQAVVQQENSGADLIVVGKAQSSASNDFLWGSVAQRILGWARSDVLVVPKAAPRGRSNANPQHSHARRRRDAVRLQPNGRRAA
jgi:nucleotide-binding universal stress UspA family protein